MIRDIVYPGNIFRTLLDELLAILNENSLGIGIYALTCEVVYRSIDVELVSLDLVDARNISGNLEVSDFPCTGSFVGAYILEADLYLLALITGKAYCLSLKGEKLLSCGTSGYAIEVI